jgi:hypothetical protein
VYNSVYNLGFAFHITILAIIANVDLGCRNDGIVDVAVNMVRFRMDLWVWLWWVAVMGGMGIIRGKYCGG